MYVCMHVWMHAQVHMCENEARRPPQVSFSDAALFCFWKNKVSRWAGAQWVDQDGWPESSPQPLPLPPLHPDDSSMLSYLLSSFACKFWGLNLGPGAYKVASTFPRAPSPQPQACILLFLPSLAISAYITGNCGWCAAKALDLIVLHWRVFVRLFFPQEVVN